VGIRKAAKSAEAAFAADRLAKLKEFIKSMDKLVAALLTLENLKHTVLKPMKKT
jgi:hypothetical protein